MNRVGIDSTPGLDIWADGNTPEQTLWRHVILRYFQDLQRTFDSKMRVKNDKDQEHESQIVLKQKTLQRLNRDIQEHLNTVHSEHFKNICDFADIGHGIVKDSVHKVLRGEITVVYGKKKI